jgi:WRKY transcription factor 1
MPPGRVVTHNTTLDSEADEKEEGDADKTPQSSALQTITKDQRVVEEDQSRKKAKTNGFEKSPVSDAKKPKEAMKEKSEDVTKDQEAKSDDKTTLESEEQKLKAESGQS